MIDVNQTKRMKELFERERTVKTDAGGQDAGDRDSAGDLRKKWKMSHTLGSKRWAPAASSRETCGSGVVFAASSVPILSTAPMRIGPQGASGCHG